MSYNDVPDPDRHPDDDAFEAHPFRNAAIAAAVTLIIGNLYCSRHLGSHTDIPLVSLMTASRIAFYAAIAAILIIMFWRYIA
jgi:hypothetical protein